MTRFLDRTSGDTSTADSGRHSATKLVALFAVLVALLTSLTLLRAGAPSDPNVVAAPPLAPSANETFVPDDPAADLLAAPVPAPWIALTDEDGEPYTLASVPPGLA